MRLFLLTQRAYFVEEDKILSALFDEGLDMLHIHKPGTEPVYAERLLMLLPEHTHKQIVVHEHFYLKDEFDLRGIHLSPENPEEPARYKGSKSITCHSLGELSANKGKYDYCMLSPVFDSISMSEHKSGFTMEQLQQAGRSGLIGKKTVAVGGVSADNITQIKELGFGAACICGDLWQHFQPHSATNYKELIHHFRTLRKLTD